MRARVLRALPGTAAAMTRLGGHLRDLFGAFLVLALGLGLFAATRDLLPAAGLPACLIPAAVIAATLWGTLPAASATALALLALAAAEPAAPPSGILLTIPATVIALGCIGMLRRRAESARTAQAFGEAGLASAAAGGWEYDLATHQFRGSPSCNILFGLPRDATTLTTTAWTARVHPQDLPRLRRTLLRASIHGQNFATEYRVRLPDGRDRWVVARGSPVTLGRRRRLAGAMIDITDRVAAEQALRLSEQRLRIALEGGRMVAWELHLATNTLSRTDNASELFGDWPDLATYQGRIHPDDQETVRTAVRAAIAACGEYRAEYRYRRHDGEWRLIRDVGMALPDMSGSPDRLVGITQDITGQRLNEQQLLLVEARFRLLADAIPGLLFATDAAGNYTLVNQSCETFTGRLQAELVGTHWTSELHPDDQAQARGSWEASAATATSYEAEYRFRRHDGAWRWFLVRSVPIRDLEGTLTQWFAVAVEIEDRRRAESVLRANDDRLRELLGMVNLATLLVRDWEGRIRFWSRGCEQLYGWSAAEATGRIAADLLGTIYPVPWTEVESVLLRDGAWRGDLMHHTRSGERIIVATHKLLRRDAAGRPDAVVESLVDVTTLRAAQAELERLNEQLEARVVQEVAAREAAQQRAAQAERMQALGQLAGGIAHDFNNVLQAVIAGAAAIERRPHAEDLVLRFAGLIKQAGSRGAGITRRLLAFARRSDLHAEAVDLPVLLAALLNMLEATLGAHITIALDLPPDLPALAADADQLETVLVNLATNARDAMPQGGTLTFWARPEHIGAAGQVPGLAPGAYVAVGVRDTGIGMDAAVLARASEPFFTTKARGEGTGLGLAMARGFAEQSGGALRIESRLGVGTNITLWLPRASGKETDPAPAAPARQTALAPNVRILLVDDDELVRDMLADELREDGFTVKTAASAAAALETLAADAARPEIDVLVTDLSMPGLDGKALIREARKYRPGLPSLLLTGYVEEGASVALDDGLDPEIAVLAKPINLRQIIARILRLAPSPSQAP